MYKGMASKGSGIPCLACPALELAMQVAPVYPTNGCSHTHTSVSFEREGSYLHQTTYIVMRCIDCLKLLDQRKLTRDSGRGGASDKK